MNKDTIDFYLEAVSSYMMDDTKEAEILHYLETVYDECLDPEQNIETIASLITKSYVKDHSIELRKLKKR